MKKGGVLIKTRWSEKASMVRGDLSRDPVLKKMDRATWVGVLGTNTYVSCAKALGWEHTILGLL